MIMCEADLEEGDWDVYAATGMDEIGEILGFRTPGKALEDHLPYDGLYNGPSPETGDDEDPVYLPDGPASSHSDLFVVPPSRVSHRNVLFRILRMTS